MHTIETENQFIELRAKGFSLARISKQINVSKPTLIDWNRKHYTQIQNLRTVALEALKEKMVATQEEELAKLGDYLYRVHKALDECDLNFVEVPHLFRIAAHLRSEIRNLAPLPDPFPPEPEKELPSRNTETP